MVLNLEVKKASGVDVPQDEGLAKGYPDKQLFKDVEVLVARGKRLGIIGPNGSGKTTLLNVLAGDLPADAGRQVGPWRGAAVLPAGPRGPQGKQHDPRRVAIRPHHREPTGLRDLAALFLFSGETAEKKNAVLSGGEKAHVSLAKLFLNPANTILMDEPTNHLDMQTAEVLEEALDADGTLILVSHDRFFSRPGVRSTAGAQGR